MQRSFWLKEVKIILLFAVVLVASGVCDVEQEQPGEGEAVLVMRYSSEAWMDTSGVHEYLILTSDFNHHIKDLHFFYWLEYLPHSDLFI